jgi:hypothetical protein
MGLFKSLRRRLRRSLIPTSLLRDIQAQRIGQGRILTELNRAKPAQPLSDSEFQVFSQWGEDGIIQKLIQHVPVKHRTFIEFGVENFVEANCRFLMINNHWRGYVLDGGQEGIAQVNKAEWLSRYDLRAVCAMITRENINQLLQASGFDADLGLLSIDVDGIDYWLFDALTAYSPRILVVEYNSLFGPTRKITVPYDPVFRRRERHYSDLYFGASLAAWNHLANARGYALVGAESAGVNAFFVRRDVLGEHLRAVSVEEVYVASNVRQSRDTSGKLDLLPLSAHATTLAGLPVINVETGASEIL